MSLLYVLKHELSYRRERVRAAGGEVGRLNIVGGAEVLSEMSSSH